MISSQRGSKKVLEVERYQARHEWTPTTASKQGAPQKTKASSFVFSSRTVHPINPAHEIANIENNF